MLESRKQFYTKHKIKIVSAFVAVFCMTCLSLCADDMTAAHAKTCRENLITEAKKYIGCPYVFGAAGPDSFDCSGLIFYAAKQANGTKLPRTAKSLYSYAKIVSDKEKEPGDLLFFKTTSSGTVSHVGIYIGNDQFISALSDGPNTGVILSSLNEAYWKPKYLGVGQIYKSGKTNAEKKAEEQAEKADENESLEGRNFFDNLIFDGTISGGWSFYKPKSFMINFRGVDFTANALFDSIPLKPGLGFSLRYNAGLDVFQIPVNISISPSDYVRFYLGPVFTVGNPKMNGIDSEFEAGVFPGIFGITLSTPSITRKSKIKVQFIQDISYSVCNKPDGSALGFKESLAAGLVFFTGVKVSLPLSIF